MPLSNRISLSLASTAAVALAALPLAVSPANAARVTEGTTSSIGVMVELSGVQPFNHGILGAQDASTGFVARGGRKEGGYLQRLLDFLGVVTPSSVCEPSCLEQVSCNFTKILSGNANVC